MSTATNLLNNKFGGIRRKTSSFSEDKITCSDCQNVELFFTELNSGIGLRTANGNHATTKRTVGNVETSCIPANEYVIEIFETIQDGIRYTLIYTESEDEGKIYRYISISNTLTLIKGGLTVTGKACGVDFIQGTRDEFIFSNGVNIVYIYTDTTTHNPLQIEPASNIHLPTDPISGATNVVGIGLVVFDSRLWFFKGKVLYYSQKAECRNFVYPTTATSTSAGYIERVKDITAIYQYLGSLAVFHNNSSTLITVDNSDGTTPSFKATDDSPGGCASYKSLVFHGTDLYFYDDTKKGVFSFQQIVNGDKTLGQNIADDIQEELMQIDADELNEVKGVSVVTADRNEVWFLLPIGEEGYSIVMIYDYIRGEWVKRKCQHINSVAVIDGTLYSVGKEIYREYYGMTFDGDFIPSRYEFSVFTLGSDNTMKITKFPPRLTVDGNLRCNFWCEYIKNYATDKKHKKKEIKTKQIVNVLKYDTGMAWDEGYIYVPDRLNAIVKLPSVNFKALEIIFYTEEEGQQFAIKAMEFSKIKVKQV